MKLFLGWSGERSKTVASALRSWLPRILPYTKPWMSSWDIESGKQWQTELRDQLKQSNSGIICVTKDNLQSRWIHYEAGVLSCLAENGRIVPLLFELNREEFTGPLSHHQAQTVDKDGLQKLVVDLNKAASKPLDERNLIIHFDQLQNDFFSSISKIEPSRTTTDIDPELDKLIAKIRTSANALEDFCYYHHART